MAKVDWPPAEKRTLIGKRIDRVDGPFKATGAAKYSYDVNRPDMLWARAVTSPYACAVLLGVESSAVEALPGVKAVWKDTELIKQGYKDGLLITRQEAEKRGFTSEKGYKYDGPGNSSAKGNCRR